MCIVIGYKCDDSFTHGHLFRMNESAEVVGPPALVPPHVDAVVVAAIEHGSVLPLEVPVPEGENFLRGIPQEGALDDQVVAAEPHSSSLIFQLWLKKN